MCEVRLYSESSAGLNLRLPILIKPLQLPTRGGGFILLFETTLCWPLFHTLGTTLHPRLAWVILDLVRSITAPMR